MRIVLFNAQDQDGGAAIAGFRLMVGLLRAGHDARMLVGAPTSSHPRVRLFPRSARLENLLAMFVRRTGFTMLEHVGAYRIHRHPWVRRADVLNFHNLHSGYFAYPALAGLTQRVPGVQTLHDIYMLTGHCAMRCDCPRWETGCGSCPDLAAYPAVNRDATRWEWKLKRRTYDRSDLGFIAPSRYFESLLSRSMASGQPRRHIPYGIDLDVYTPRKRHSARDALGVPRDRLVLLAGAQSLTDHRKGGDILLESINTMPEATRRSLFLLLIGAHAHGLARQLHVDHKQLGYVASDDLKAMVFSAADAFLFPTRMDNLPLMIQESLACGTPVISTRVGGVPEMVVDGETGYLAERADPPAVAETLQRALADPGRLRDMRPACRAFAEREYALDLCVERTIQFFQERLAS